MDIRPPDWASLYVGIPYQTHGEDYHGCDCWGLLALVLREQFGITLPRYTGAGWMRGQTPAVVGGDAREYASAFAQVPAGDERSGDAILIRMRGHPLHVGVVITPGLMLHVHEDADACIEPYNAPRWQHRIVAFYRAEDEHLRGTA